MISFAQLSVGLVTDSPEWSVGVPVLLFLLCIGGYVFVRWLLLGPVSPDPWDKAVAADLADDRAVPLCHRCLAPHDPQADFCPECGATVGQYTNLLPYPYIFSVGDTLRLGTSGEFRRTPFTILGFLVFACVEYTVFAPWYWIRFFQGKPPHRPPALPAESGPG
jgi:hypothetical protein